MPHDHIALLRNLRSKEMVERVCAKYGVVPEVFEELIQAKLKQAGKLRKHGLRPEFDDILDRIKTDD